MADQTEPVRPSELPLWWWLIILGLTALGFALWKLAPTFPAWMTRASNLIPADRWHLLTAICLFGLVGSHLAAHLMRRVLDALFVIRYRRKERNEQEGETYFPPAFVGFAEAILYPTALLIGQPEFIGFWLALKVAGQWKEWESGYQGRARFNRFLVGSALSIMVSGLTYGAFKSFVLDP